MTHIIAWVGGIIATLIALFLTAQSCAYYDLVITHYLRCIWKF